VTVQWVGEAAAEAAAEAVGEAVGEAVLAVVAVAVVVDAVDVVAVDPTVDVLVAATRPQAVTVLDLGDETTRDARIQYDETTTTREHTRPRTRSKLNANETI
jgi:hypothetical protein